MPTHETLPPAPTSLAPTSLAASQAVYQQAYQQAWQALLNSLRPPKAETEPCPICQAHAQANSTRSEVFHPLLPETAPPQHECPWQPWRQQALAHIENELGAQLLAALEQLNAERDAIDCKQSGTCCRLAHSLDSWSELQAKAEAGDTFAKDFTRVFLPYDLNAEQAEQKAQAAFPSEVQQLRAYLGDKPVHFYRCAYIGEDNRCTLFGSEKRPGFCSTYPETPLNFVYRHCAWSTWQQTNHNRSVQLRAAITACETASQRLRSGLA